MSRKIKINTLICEKVCNADMEARKMAETISTAGRMERVIKDNGTIADMTPSALLHGNNNNNIPLTHSLRSFKQINTEEQTASDANLTAGKNVSTSDLLASPSMTTFRCERCDNYETNSRATLLLHVVQCLSSPVRLKIEEPEHDHLTMTAVTQIEQSSSEKATKIADELQAQLGSIASSGIGPVIANGSASSPASASSTLPSSRKVFECDVCNMKFSNGANMRRHKMRHTGVKPYECRVCQKRFFRKDHLAEHFTTHTKTLPYHCPICNRGFQRQIAMRAHFQNEHVGQHDLVKTCPLCSYRAGSMKSLRIHFFNRHGIDLDNPGPGGASTLLLALESQASQVAAAAAAAGFVPGLNAVAAAAAAANVNVNMPSHQSDSGESLRSMDNATPPMHFLTPHVEISTLSENGTEVFNGNSTSGTMGSEFLDCKTRERDITIESPAPQTQEHPMDCNTKSLPSSTSNSSGAQQSASPKSHHHHHENHITPSISLIPIKQEPIGEDLSSDLNKCGSNITSCGDQINGGDNGESDLSSPNNRLTSLIKVSPLKSLLREDLKRRICAKANNRITRNAAALENNNVIQCASTPTNSSICNSTPICNGTITSTGQETETSVLNRKQILTCLFCGIEFPDETLYFLHKGCHCESNPWKCNICGEQCNNVYEFNSHLLSKSHQ